MIKLILVRHGQYDEDGHLSYEGRDRIMMLVQKLEQLITEDMSVSIVTSPTDRTYETAQIIGEALGVGVEKSQILLSEGQAHRMDLPGAYNLIKSKDKFDIVIIVSHFDYVADLPKYFALKELGVKLQSKEIGKGAAWVVDCIDKTLTLLN